MAGSRLEFALALAERAGALGLEYFRRLETLTVTAKGHQDLVSEADRDVETLVRAALAEAYPDDGIVGEEHGRLAGTSGYTWVIDPIDGTANFVAGIPQWCVVIACVKDGETVIGITYDPVAREMFHAEKGSGTFVNGRLVKVSSSDSLGRGSVGVGFSGRSHACGAVQVIDMLVAKGGVFFRNASGGLMLAYVASGRLIGYCEAHMNAWDCLAGLLMIEEAGGFAVAYDAEAALTAGVRVIAGGKGIEADLIAICDASFPKVA